MNARRFCGAAALAAILLAGLLTSPAHGFDIDNPHRLSLGGAVELLDPGALDLLAAPMPLLRDGFSAEAGVLRLYELAELDAKFVAAAVRYGAFTGSLGVQQFGQSDYFAEKTARLTVARGAGAVSTALIASLRRWEFGGGYGAVSAASLGAALGVRSHDATVALIVDNLNHPRPQPGAPRGEPRCELTTQLRASEKVSAFALGSFERRRAPRWGVGQSARLTGAFELRWGLRWRPVEFGGGFVLRAGSVSIAYAGSFHPDLGYTHGVTISL